MSATEAGSGFDPSVLRALLLDQVRSAVIATDLDGLVTIWNAFAAELYGWTAEESLGRHIGELTAWPAGGPHAREIIETVTARGAWNGKLTVCRKDGTPFEAHLSSSLVRDPSGEPVGVVGVSIDLAPIEAAEAEARRRSEVSVAVLDALPTPMVVLDATGVIIAVNRAWTRDTEAGGEHPTRAGVGADYVGVRFGDVSSPPGATISQGIRRVLDGGGSWSSEYPSAVGDSTRWTSCEVTGLPGGGCVVLHRDITAMVDERETLRRLAEAKDRLVTMVSHEVRTPLTAVLGLAEELVASSDLPAAQVAEFHQIIAEQAREVSSIVEDLLVIARLDNDTLMVARQSLDLAAVVTSVLRPFQVTAGPIGLTVPDEPVWATGDQARLRQVIRNLVNNAIRHGSPPIEVSVGWTTDGAVVTVSDHGPGVAPGDVESVFRTFGRQPSSDSPDSVGIGLWVARALVERMGGRLDYRRDHRTDFVIVLPREAPGSGD